jgi:L-ascorbate metabolism protein UlaG (beta-lactamase superfamily)
MKIQKFLHSCLLIEHEGARVLFDPGLYSFIEGRVKPEDFKNIDAVFITHEHFDHVDATALKIILKNNPKASVYGNSGVVDHLKKEGITVLVFEDGEKRINGLPIWAKFAQHATILSPAPKNTAYIVGGKLLITGDSFDEELEKLKGIEILALPITAPWLRSVDAVAFAGAIGAKKVIPVHDGFAKDFFLERQYPGFAKIFAEVNIDFHPLAIGEVFEI